MNVKFKHIYIELPDLFKTMQFIQIKEDPGSQDQKPNGPQSETYSIKLTWFEEDIQSNYSIKLTWFEEDIQSNYIYLFAIVR